MGGSVIDPPEALVFGAKLQCTQSLNPTFLMVGNEWRNIASAPAACVTDSKPVDNIPPFGTCRCGLFGTNPCEDGIMQFDKWENPDQTEYINGEPIITTSSWLVCEAQGGRITPVNSGQDQEIFKQFQFIQEMKEKYPGLVELVMNPYGSIYSPIDVHGDALKLLQDITDFSGGSINLMAQDNNSLLGPLILASVNQLIPSAGFSGEALLTGMEGMLARTGVNDGADPHTLDANLLDAITKDSGWYAEKVAKGGFYKFQEDHKQLAAFLADMVQTAAYAAIMYGSTMGGGAGYPEYAAEDYLPEGDTAADGRVPEGYTQDENGRWHRPDGTFSSNEEVGLPPTGGAHYLDRPYIRQSTVDGVNAKTIYNSEGQLWDDISKKWVDPNGVQLGHVPGHEFWWERNQAESQGMTQAEFNNYMNNPDFYAWQDAPSNESHAYEDPH